MKEGRKHHRANVLDEFIVTDTLTGQTLGTMRNISEGGLMIIGAPAITLEEKYFLTIRLPKKIKDQDVLELLATCQWSVFDEARGIHKSGFRFPRVSSNEREVIMILQTEYEFEVCINSK